MGKYLLMFFLEKPGDSKRYTYALDFPKKEERAYSFDTLARHLHGWGSENSLVNGYFDSNEGSLKLIVGGDPNQKDFFFEIPNLMDVDDRGASHSRAYPLEKICKANDPKISKLIGSTCGPVTSYFFDDSPKDL